ncbi:MAG: DUF2062 domain-containing protein [Bacteroidota bacterium]|nr:DUF2062 domain-containing protein [Bacteroidota bacterium]
MKDLRCCVIMPTFNNAGTLESVIRDVEDFTEDIIIVNDGSTDETSSIIDHLADRSLLTVISYPSNRGKGFAIRNGFKKAIEMGFRYAITIDSDGQHYAEDIPKFIEMVENHPDSMIIGAREMNKPEIPGSSHFGHKFSIFWFKVETGIKIPDVQSGYRLYPLDKLKKLHFHTTKYEFEVEVMVRLAWHRIPLHFVPIEVYYAPPEERVSHFRKFTDFTRVSILNTLFVFMGLLWYRPVLLFRGLAKMSFKEFLKKYVIDSSDSNLCLALSVALGMLIGCSPFWGWQMMLAYSLARVLHLNKFVAVTASNISIPPLLPVILFLSYLAGGLALGLNIQNVEYNSGIDFAWVKKNILQYLAGSIIFGLVLGIAMGVISFILLEIFRKNGSRKYSLNGKIRKAN